LIVDNSFLSIAFPNLEIKTRLIDEKFVSVMGECDLDVIGVPSNLNVIRKVTVLGRVRSTFPLSCEENRVVKRTPHDGSGTDHGHVGQPELLNL
jgi:hypothetical protein